MNSDRNIVQSTRAYERWLARQIQVIPSQLRLKHSLMRKQAFSFLRATYYRWAQIWPTRCAGLAAAPVVLGVGDLHVENFGTWRDLEGRLVWGINDLDEAAPQPYTNDLVRLAASAILAHEEGMFAVEDAATAKAILKGYCEGLQERGCPFLLGEKNKRLLHMAAGELRAPFEFWRKMDVFKTLRRVPPSAARALQSVLPEKRLAFTFAQRICGLGSLGRPRYVALAEWQGGRIAREAKATAPSALVWAGKQTPSSGSPYNWVLDHAVRSGDPFLRVAGTWVVRRLSPDCSRIELADLPAKRDELRLLYCMGWETANIHLGTSQARGRILADLGRRHSGWLLKASREMVQSTLTDWEYWRKATRD